MHAAINSLDVDLHRHRKRLSEKEVVISSTHTEYHVFHSKGLSLSRTGSFEWNIFLTLKIQR